MLSFSIFFVWDKYKGYIFKKNYCRINAASNNTLKMENKLKIAVGILFLVSLEEDLINRIKYHF
jgi:hypothetical protein